LLPQLRVGILHRGEHGFVFLFTGDVFHFLWILFEIEEHPFLAVRKIHELVAGVADAIVAGDMMGFLTGVEVIDRIAPIRCCRDLRLDHGNQAFALDIGGDYRSGDFKEGGCVVDVLDQRLALGAGLGDARPFQDEGHGEGFLEHPALVIPAVLAEVEALIRGVDDDGVFSLAAFVEIVEHATDVLIDGADTGEVVLEVTLVFPLREILVAHGRECGDEGIALRGVGLVESFLLLRGHPCELAVRDPGFEAGIGGLAGQEHVIAPVEMLGDLHLLLRERRDAVLVVVEKRWRLRDGDAIEEIVVAGSGHPVAVRGFLLAHQDEGLGLVLAAFEPGYGLVGYDVGHVSGEAFRGAVHLDEVRVVVVSLAREDFPVVEAGGVGDQVPFPDDRSFIAGLPEELREGLLCAVETAVGVIHITVQMGVLAGQDRGAGGAADGISAVGAAEQHAFVGNAVDIRRGRDLVEAVTVGGNCLQRVVVGEDEEDVRALGGPGDCHGGENEEKESERFIHDFGGTLAQCACWTRKKPGLG